MTHVITLGDILFWVGIPVGLLLLGLALLAIIAFLNPFSSGH